MNDLTLPAAGCPHCGERRSKLGFDFTMAFQPIVDLTTGRVFAQEALARGCGGQGAGYVFEHVNEQNQYTFDQACRVKAIQLAAELKIDSFVSVNFMPNAVYEPAQCISTTLKAARAHGFPIERIIFEFTEQDRVDDYGHLRNIIEHYQKLGFMTAIDDFGAGYSGLNLLADIQTDLVKLDMALIRDIDRCRVRRAIVRGALQICEELNIRVIAEGIETYEEMAVLRDFGVQLFQGYYFARPAFRSLATVNTDRLSAPPPRTVP